MFGGPQGLTDDVTEGIKRYINQRPNVPKFKEVVDPLRYYFVMVYKNWKETVFLQVNKCLQK